MTEPRPVDLVIAGGLTLTLNPEREVLQDGLIAIDGPRIVAVGTRSELEGAFAPRRRIDARDKLVMPGMVDGHRHLIESARGLIPDNLITRDWLRDWCYPYLGHINEEQEYHNAKNIIANMLRTGTTTVVDPGIKFPASTFEAIAESGIRAVTGIWTWDQMGPDAEKCAPHFFKLSLEDALAQTEETISRYHGMADGRVSVWATLEGVGTCSDTLMVEAYKIAQAHGTSILMHKATSKEERERERELFGRTPVEHMADIGVLGPDVYFNHATAVTLEEVSLLANSGTKICENPSAALKLAKGTTQMGHFVEMMQAGVTVCLGCDGSNSSDFSDMVRAMHLAAALPNDQYLDPTLMTAERAIELATIEGAKAVRLEHEIGSVEVGKRADIVLFDMLRSDWAPTFNPINVLVYSATGDSVDTVLVDGRVVVEGGEVLTIDERETVRTVNALRADVLAAAGLEVQWRWPLR